MPTQKGERSNATNLRVSFVLSVKTHARLLSIARKEGRQRNAQVGISELVRRAIDRFLIDYEATDSSRSGNNG